MARPRLKGSSRNTLEVNVLNAAKALTRTIKRAGGLANFPDLGWGWKAVYDRTTALMKAEKEAKG
jgi:hypothetical protein